MTLVAPQPVSSPAPTPAPALAPAAERRIVLDGISWSTYQQLLRESGDRNTRLTFDNGRLELMSPSLLHERVKTVIRRLVEVYADALQIEVEGAGSTTCDREDLQKGLEPDECYYITHAAAVMGKEKLDLTVDPPPDLAIEVDISRPDVVWEPIYAALGVPEVWRFDGRAIQLLVRNPDGHYVTATSSLAFPNLPLDLLNQWLQIGLEQGQSAAVRALREWLRSSGRQ